MKLGPSGSTAYSIIWQIFKKKHIYDNNKTWNIYF